MGTPALMAGSRRGVNWLDFVIVVTIIWFGVAGMTTGLVREIVTWGAALLGVALAGRYYLKLADDIRIVHDGATVDDLIAFIAIFAGVVLAGHILGAVLKGAVSLLLLGWLDRAGGLLFGLIKGAIIVEAVLIAFATFPAAGWMTQALDTSLLAPVFLSGVPWLLHLLPGSFKQGVAGY